MSFKTDFHIHSHYSDGTMSPSDIVKKYIKDEFDMIAITDHEVTDGIAEAVSQAKDENIKIISGIEFSTDMDGKEIHILGYYFDPDNGQLKEQLKYLANIRKERNDRLLKALQSQGFDICERDLIQREGQTYIGKPNFARALAAKGYISNMSEAFEPGKLLESDEIKSIKREKISAAKAIEIIRNAGGIAVLAHPCKIKGIGERESSEFKENFEILLKELKKCGLKGIECIYPKHSDNERLWFIDMASKYHLHITEGSDFHGDR